MSTSSANHLVYTNRVDTLHDVVGCKCNWLLPCYMSMSSDIIGDIESVDDSPSGSASGDELTTAAEVLAKLEEVSPSPTVVHFMNFMLDA